MSKERIGTCATCAFWHDVNGQCRAVPPTPVATITQTPNGATAGISSTWAKVDSNDWCGEYYDGRRDGVRHTYDRLVDEGHVEPHTWYFQHRKGETNEQD